jgi:hypothetical protein
LRFIRWFCVISVGFDFSALQTLRKCPQHATRCSITHAATCGMRRRAQHQPDVCTTPSMHNINHLRKMRDKLIRKQLIQTNYFKITR